MDSARIKSIAVLGYHFNLHIIKSIFTSKKENQAELFKSYFREDRIAPLTLEEHEALEAFQNCVTCGLCPAHCTVMDTAAGKFKGPMHIAATASRSHPDFVHDLDSIVLCAVCGQCEPICPEGVPIAEMSATMRRIIWRVAAEHMPESYRAAEANLRCEKNVYGKPADFELPTRDDADTIYVAGPYESARDPESAIKACSLLEKMGRKVKGIKGGSVGGVAESLGLTPDRGWLEELARDPAGEIVTSDPELWLALSKEKSLEPKSVKSIIHVISEEAEKLGKLKVEGPAVFHLPYPFARGADAPDVLGFLREMGVELTEPDPSGEDSPPLGWEGGIELADPELAGSLASRRASDALRAGAVSIITLCPADRSALRDRESGIRVEYLVDMVYDLLG